MKNNRLYLDYNATTPVDQRIVQAMIPYFNEMFGNASSKSHPYGHEATWAVFQARAKVAELIQVQPEEIIFTGGATESDNLGIIGIYQAYRQLGDHIITVKTEHKAVLESCKYLENNGAKVTYLDVDSDGLINLDELETAITDRTILVSIMWANNETGVIQPMDKIGEICKKNRVLLMSDATQAVGKIEVNPKIIGVHIMAFTAHKMYGPKGIGAIYINKKSPEISIHPLIHGGGQEQNIRSGTLNVPSIVGFGEAALIAGSELTSENRRLAQLRDYFEKSLIENMGFITINGSTTERLGHVSNMAFNGLDGAIIMSDISDSIAASAGSTCDSGLSTPSYVLKAMGLSDEKARSSIRFSLGRYTIRDDIHRSIQTITDSVLKLKAALNC